MCPAHYRQGLGTWVMIAQGDVKATDPTTLIPVIMRIRYLIITTFCLNVFCAGVYSVICIRCNPSINQNVDVDRHDLLENLETKPGQSS